MLTLRRARRLHRRDESYHRPEGLLATEAMAAPEPRVAIFETYLFPHAYGNLRYLEAFFRHIPEEELSRYVLISPRPDYRPGEGSPLAGRIVAAPAPSTLMRFGGGSHVGKKAWRLILPLLLYNLRLRRVLRRERIDVLQCQNVRSVVTSALAAKLGRAHIVWYVKGHLDNPVLDRIAYRVSTR